MIDKIKKACTGCGACACCCPKQCISLRDDSEGFGIPEIDNLSCIKCNLCEKVCPVINHENLYTGTAETVKGVRWSRQNSEIKQSASAGVAYALSKIIIQKGGVAAGAALIDGAVKHIVASTLDELKLTKNSKYVQSYTRDAFDAIIKILKDKPDQYVLFSGTPCQCAAFKNILSLTGDYPNVYILDFVCHGVPSPLVFKKYLEWLQNKLNEKIVDYQFRYKYKGWNYNGYMSSYTKVNDKVWSTQRDPYMASFLGCCNYRESCYQCSFVQKRGSDITVADFGGVKQIATDFFDKSGCSVIIEHSDKGRRLFNEIIDDCDIVDIEFSEAAKYNPNLVKSTRRPAIRDKIYDGINELDGVKYVQKKLMPQVTKKGIIKFYIPERVKAVIKRVYNRFH